MGRQRLESLMPRSSVQAFLRRMRNNIRDHSKACILTTRCIYGFFLAVLLFWLWFMKATHDNVSIIFDGRIHDAPNDNVAKSAGGSTTTNFVVDEKVARLAIESDFVGSDRFDLEAAFYEDVITSSTFGGKFVRFKFQDTDPQTLSVGYMKHDACFGPHPEIPIAPVSTPGKNEIPKKLHFVQVCCFLDPSGDPRVPKSVQENIERWQRMHPDWEIHVWTNQDVHALLLQQQDQQGDGNESRTGRLFLELLQEVSKAPITKSTVSWMSDLLRYYIVYHIGGVYVDTDTVAVRPLDLEVLLNNSQTQNGLPKAFTVCEYPRTFPSSLNDASFSWSHCEHAGSSLFGAVPGHPVLRDTLAEIIENSQKALCMMDQGLRKGYHADIAGPPVWSAACMKHAKSVALLQAGTFM